MCVWLVVLVAFVVSCGKGEVGVVAVSTLLHALMWCLLTPLLHFFSSSNNRLCFVLSEFCDNVEGRKSGRYIH